MILVLDSSAILAAYNNEQGADKVRGAAGQRLVSAVNFSEVEAKLLERGMPQEAILLLESYLPCDIIDFDRALASLCAKLRQLTKRRGLSLGDRACLALAIRENATALTADRAWAELDIGMTVELIR